jgi:DNA-binding transcriptional LysR family regulator
MIEVRLMEHALAVAEEASFALAAQALGISQPALSRSIQSLETQLGVQLFERSHRRIEPTNAGRVFLERARELVARHAQLTHEMGLLTPGSNSSISLVVGPYVADLVAAPAIAAAAALHPSSQFRLRVDSWVEAIKAVRAREIDLAVADCSQILDDPELAVSPLGTNQGYLVVRPGHPLLSQRAVGIAQILAFPLVSSSRLPPRVLGPLVQERAQAAVAKMAGFPAILCEQVSVMRTIVAASDAVGMFTLSLVEQELTSGALVPLPCHLPWLHTQFGVVHRRNRALSPELTSLIKLITKASRELERREGELRSRFAIENLAG